MEQIITDEDMLSDDSVITEEMLRKFHNNKTKFKECKESYRVKYLKNLEQLSRNAIRDIGINQYMFISTYDMNHNRENRHWFSEQFNSILDKHTSITELINYSQGHIRDKIKKLFIEHKDTLTDLEWYNAGYF